ncbi:GNAT family N-acetyltransferase [Streptomyces sp. SCSIO 30461]|uniref:GNAT family N-acetyltransferase n=1 Tax=Streptomyces sp. SCSIO 30461 TaxID=3118085 RepID=UPI00387E6CEB
MGTPAPGTRIAAVGPQRAHVLTAAQRAAREGARFTDERPHAMAAGLPYQDARCLVAFDDHGAAVAAVTVWSAGPGRPGLLEPTGVHREHRRHGHGTAITPAAAAALREPGAPAAAAALREPGSSSAIVCTPSSGAGAVAGYRPAGRRKLPEARDRYRDA